MRSHRSVWRRRRRREPSPALHFTTPRNPIQQTPLLAHIVLKLRCVVFDFGACALWRERRRLRRAPSLPIRRISRRRYRTGEWDRDEGSESRIRAWDQG
eukprot:2326284-Rhodomonas_salina.1